MNKIDLEGRRAAVTGGAHGVFLENHAQRRYRDVRVAANHIAQSWDIAATCLEKRSASNLSMRTVVAQYAPWVPMVPKLSRSQASPRPSSPIPYHTP